MFRVISMTVTILISQAILAEPTPPIPSSYRLGVFPYMATRQIVELYGPLVANLESAMRHPIRLESSASFPDYSRELTELSFDIALIQPFDYLPTVETSGYLPLAQIDAKLVTQVIVRDDSRYHKLTDLLGTTIGLPPEQSASARLTLRSLKKYKLIPSKNVQIKYFKTHDSCLQQMWAGETSACATSRTPLMVFQQRMQATLRSIYNTQSIPNALFVVHPRVPIADRVKLQQLLVGLKHSQAGLTILKSLGLPGFRIPQPNEYAVMRNYEVNFKPSKIELTASKDLIFGVLPYIPPRKLAENFSLALLSLNKATKMKIHLRTTSNYSSFTDSINAENYDIVLTQPFEYSNAIKHGYLPLAGMKDNLETYFYVLANSPYQQISDLNEQIIAMPPVNSAQSRVGRQCLINAGMTPENMSIAYSNNNEACLQRVQTGEAAACAAASVSLPMLMKEITQELRSIGICPEVPGVLFMAHKRLPLSLRTKLSAEIVSWKDQAEGRKILDSIHLGEFIPVFVNDYLHLSNLKNVL